MNLDTLLTNSWMASPDFTAQMAHLFFAGFVIVVASLFGERLTPVVLLGATLAALKEFWFDLTYELPAQTLSGSTLDFAMYLAGMGVGMAVVWLRGILSRTKA